MVMSDERLTTLDADALAMRQAAEAVLDAWTEGDSWTPLDDAIAALGGTLLSVTARARLLSAVEIGRDVITLLRALADRAQLNAADRRTIMALLRRTDACGAPPPPTGGNHADNQH
jgi:hypothetical protein